VLQLHKSGLAVSRQHALNFYEAIILCLSEADICHTSQPYHRVVNV